MHPVCRSALDMLNDVTQPFFWFHIVQTVCADRRVKHHGMFTTAVGTREEPVFQSTTTPHKALLLMLLSIPPCHYVSDSGDSRTPLAFLHGFTSFFSGVLSQPASSAGGECIDNSLCAATHYSSGTLSAICVTCCRVEFRHDNICRKILHQSCSRCCSMN